MILSILLSLSFCEVYFQEEFERGWEKRWVKSEKHPPGKPFGRWQHTSGSTPGDPKIQHGLKTLDNYRHYAISSRFDKCVRDKDTPLIIQYVVKQDRPLICGGCYIKLIDDGLDQKRFTGGTPYSIMFGPDICFAHTHQLKLIISRNGTNFNMNQAVDPFDDGSTHMYTLYLLGNQTFIIYADGEPKYASNFAEEFEYEGPKYIMDPYDRKPKDWDDREYVPDPDDVKPEDWDDIQFIVDKSAKKPKKWKDDTDGEWTPPHIPNPKYQGIWKPKEIPNNEYRGLWRPRKILNPDYSPDPDFGRFDNLCYLGIDIHQDNAGTLFQNFLVTDNATYADEMAQRTFHNILPLEAAVFSRWGGKDRWERQRDWGILDFGASKNLTRDENGNMFGDPDTLYHQISKKQHEAQIPQPEPLDSRGFGERNDV